LKVKYAKPKGSKDKSSNKNKDSEQDDWKTDEEVEINDNKIPNS